MKQVKNRLASQQGMATVEFVICLPVVIFMISIIYYFVQLNGYEQSLQNVGEQTVRVIAAEAGLKSVSDANALQIAQEIVPDDIKPRLKAHLEQLDGGFIKLQTSLDLSGTPIGWLKPMLNNELTSKIER